MATDLDKGEGLPEAMRSKESVRKSGAVWSSTESDSRLDDVRRESKAGNPPKVSKIPLQLRCTSSKKRVAVSLFKLVALHAIRRS